MLSFSVMGSISVDILCWEFVHFFFPQTLNGHSSFHNSNNGDYQSIFHNSWKTPGINYHYPHNPPPQQFAHDFYMKNHQAKSVAGRKREKIE